MAFFFLLISKQLIKELKVYMDFAFFLYECTGKRALHLSECSKKFDRAETTPTTAAGGGQRTGRLHRYFF